jgi:hypothetical protein
MNPFTLLMLLMAAMFSAATMICYAEGKPFTAMFMAFTSSIIVCSIAMSA